MDQYLPEFIVMINLLQEVVKRDQSFWYPWIQSLPREFSTGLWMDEYERAIVDRLAPQFLAHQEHQWEAFKRAFETTKVVVADLEIVNHDIFQWAFSVVFTRSWRTPDGKHAAIVPLGDMFNHGLPSNIHVKMHADACQMLLKEAAQKGEGLYLDYGISQFPERFLVMYGFCDRSCQTIYIDIPFNKHEAKVAQNLGFRDFTKVFINVDTLELSETAFDAIMYKIAAEDLTENYHLATTKALQEKLVVDWINIFAKEKVELFTSCLALAEAEIGKHKNAIAIAAYCKFFQDFWKRLHRQTLK